MSNIKEIQLTLRINENDLKRKIEHMNKFLSVDKKLVKVKVKFKFRELSRQSEALDFMKRISDDLKLVSKVINSPVMKTMGFKQDMIMMLTPK